MLHLPLYLQIQRPLSRRRALRQDFADEHLDRAVFRPVQALVRPLAHDHAGNLLGKRAHVEAGVRRFKLTVPVQHSVQPQQALAGCDRATASSARFRSALSGELLRLS